MSIPVVDVAAIGLEKEDRQLLSCQSEQKEIGKHLSEAFSSFGFVYIINHGLAAQDVSQLFRSSRDFFQLPLKQKRLFQRQPTHPDRVKAEQGFIEQNQERLDALKKSKSAQQQAFLEIREAFDVVAFEGGNFPDDLCPQLKPAFQRIGQGGHKLLQRLLKALALHLDLRNDFLRDTCNLFTEINMTKMRSLYYPPIVGQVEAGAIRCGEHADFSLLTFLWQDSMGGLEVQGRDGEWMAIHPRPEAILVESCLRLTNIYSFERVKLLQVNVGEMLEIYTHGLYPAAIHRVIVPKDEAERALARQSIAFFTCPDNDVTLEPILGRPNWIQGSDPFNQFKAKTIKEYIQQKFAQVFGQK